MKRFNVESEYCLEMALFSNLKRKFSLSDEFAFGGFKEGGRGQYFYGHGESGEIDFVIHPNFTLNNNEVCLYMSDEKCNPAVEEDVVDLLTEILGIDPLFRLETMDYDDCYDEFYKRPAYLYVWVADVDDPKVKEKIREMERIYLVEMLQ